MRRIFITWIGNTDLDAPQKEQTTGAGPVAQALMAREYDDAYLLVDHKAEVGRRYRRWLQERCECATRHLLHEELTGPTQFGEIYPAAVRACETALAGGPRDTELTFHLSPGTPAMAAVWIILAKTRFPAELIESSKQHGVSTVSVPFDISADFLPDLLRRPDEELERLSAGLPPEAPEFEEILHGSQAMQRVILRARRVAPRSVPVLIEGETGTGKELLARAIHRTSPRRDKPFLAVNCGAIPPEIVESELFGHVKGAFTGATKDRKGHFEEASGGTLFLDEVGELPKSAQVKLLRALQEGEVIPVGSSRSRKVDVRVIAATNRSLLSEVADGAFREDLFHRLAVAVLQLPPLRDRRDDLPLLIDYILALVNREGREQPGFVEKELSPGARNLLLAHPWPGNVRELQNTLGRAAIWTPEATLKTEDIRDALLPAGETQKGSVLGKPLGEGLDLPGILASVARHYLERALDEAQGNKTRAADLVGLPSYQTLTNWMKRYGVGE
ncbi:MAG: sigma-54 dependent transcriptional regulator [Gemmatimonadetes bacterium]|nr:sigma-54 dependent transcriptional regulator [Gemmatimonadota bacterium]